MQSRRSLVFAALFLVAAVGLFFLWKSLGAPTAPLAGVPPSAQPAGATEVPPAAALASTESTSALEVADESSQGSADARTPAALDANNARTENFAVDDTRWIEGRVQFPPGTPADEALEVWMLPATVRPSADAVLQRFGGSFDSYSRIQAARANEAQNDWAVRTVGSDGAFRVPYPKDAQSVSLTLAGRYLYLDEPVPVSVKEKPAPAVLEPVLGGWLIARCKPPVGADAELVGAATTLSGFKMDARAMRTGRGFVNRQTEVGKDLAFEQRALPADLRYTLIVSPKTLAIATQADFQITAGKKTEVEVVLEPGARVRGRIHDEHDTPVAGVAIESQERRFNMSMGFGDTQRKTESAADGTFELAGLRAGKTRLSAKLDGYVDGQSDEITLAVGETKDGVDIQLPRGNQISGRVTWPDAQPASGATVSAREPAEPNQPRGPRRMRPQRTSRGETRSAVANDKGEFTLTGLGEGPFSVEAGLRKPPSARTATAPERTPEVEHTLNDLRAAGVHLHDPSDKGPLWTATLHDIAPGTNGLAFVLREPSGLKGRIVDDAGAAVAEFAVAATPSFGDGGPIVDRSLQSQSFKQTDGTFLLEGLQDGKYSVSVTATGYLQTGEHPSIVMPQSESELVITLARTGSVAGRVVDPSGRPVAGASVSAGTPGTGRPFNFNDDEVSGDSDENGDFALESVPAGTLTLVASADTWAKSDPLTVQVVPRQKTAGLLITLRSGGRLTGEIYNTRGEAAVGRAIQMFSMDAGDMRSLVADAAGRFEAEHLTPGTYQLIAEPGKKERDELERRMDSEDANPAEMMASLKMTSATIKDGEETHVVMGAPPKAPVKVTGTITSAGEPAGGRSLMAIGEGGAMLESFKVGKVDATGHYEITLDKPGPVVLVVSKDADPGRGVEFYETIPEVAEHRLDLALPLGGIRGRVRGPDHRPLASVSVQLMTDGGSASLSMMSGRPTGAQTDADGRFEFTELHPGTFAVAAGGSMGRRFTSEDSPHGRSVRGSLKVEADKMLEGVELELSTPGKITGRVVDASGQAAAGATVYVRDAQGELLHRFSACASDTAGRFTYEGVAPGKYTLSAHTKTLATRESSAVAVQENQTSEVDLALEPGTWLRISLENSEHKAVRAQISVKNERDQEVGTMLDFETFQSMFSEGISSTERRVGPMPGGKYVVTATTTSGQTTKKSVTLKGQDERKIVLRLD